MSKAGRPPHTPDGRYFVMVGRAGPRLWRATKPNLDPEERARLTKELMAARRAAGGARGDRRGGDRRRARKSRHGQGRFRGAGAGLVERRCAGPEPAPGQGKLLRRMVGSQLPVDPACACGDAKGIARGGTSSRLKLSDGIERACATRTRPWFHRGALLDLAQKRPKAWSSDAGSKRSKPDPGNSDVSPNRKPSSTS